MPYYLVLFLILFVPLFPTVAAERDAVELQTLAGDQYERLQQAIEFATRRTDVIKKPSLIILVDYSRPSTDHRMRVFDLAQMTSRALLVAHGRGSDPDHDAVATHFSNVPGSKATSLGYFRVSEQYMGVHGTALRLDGLEASNDKARERAIVIHSAQYVSAQRSPIGRSWGCPVVESSEIDWFADAAQDGALLFAYTGDIQPN
jgi:hypothetical protein